MKGRIHSAGVGRWDADWYCVLLSAQALCWHYTIQCSPPFLKNQRGGIILHLQKTRPKPTVVLWNSKLLVGGCQEKVSQRAVFWEKKPQRSPLNPPYAPGALGTPVGRWVRGSGPPMLGCCHPQPGPSVPQARGSWLILPMLSCHLGVYLIVFEMRAVSLQHGPPSAGS